MDTPAQFDQHGQNIFISGSFLNFYAGCFCGESESSQLERFKDFETQLNNVTLNVVGKDKPPTEESYTILSVSKFGKGDLWVFK